MDELLAQLPDGRMTLTKEGGRVCDEALFKSFDIVGDILTLPELGELAALRAQVAALTEERDAALEEASDYKAIAHTLDPAVQAVHAAAEGKFPRLEDFGINTAGMYVALAKKFAKESKDKSLEISALTEDRDRLKAPLEELSAAMSADAEKMRLELVAAGKREARLREALEEIERVGTRVDLCRVGDPYSDLGYEECTRISPEAEIARAALHPTAREDENAG